ncbi:MAG: hypothetical protein DLM66_14875 [Candidatus Dormiibacter spiritus]|nr:MAG: hypothetical protein DLM66_14875 [Candidatus Dormibacteraeota bacterium]
MDPEDRRLDTIVLTRPIEPGRDLPIEAGIADQLRLGQLTCRDAALKALGEGCRLPLLEVGYIQVQRPPAGAGYHRHAPAIAGEGEEQTVAGRNGRHRQLASRLQLDGVEN